MKLRTIGEEELQEILKEHKVWLKTVNSGERADLRDTDLRGADLRDTDLRGAYLRGADLRDADLRGADLRDTDLRDTNLRDADLRDTDLIGADLRDTNLRGADLRGADLKDTDLIGADLRDTDLIGADLDYSVLPLWCGGLDMRTDSRLMRQLAYHFCKQGCDDPEYIEARNAILDFANKFHRVNECGRLERK